MISSLVTTLGCIVAYLAVPTLSQNLGKPALRSDLSYLDGPLWQYLTPTPATWSQWGFGWIPESCLDEVNRDHKCNVADVQVFDVHYNDYTVLYVANYDSWTRWLTKSANAWVMCRCSNADMSISQMVDAFGRLPVRYRQWIRHVVAFTDSGRHAYAVNGEIVFFKDSYVSTIWVHESSHIVDNFAISVNGARFSQSQTWIDAINLDPKVPDPYSNTNVVEDFAQVANMAMFDRVSPNGISSVEPNWVQIFNQLASAESSLSDNLLPGGFCTRRWADSTIVAMPLRTTSDRVANKPAYMPKNINATNVEEAVIVFESPDMAIIHDTHHT